MKKKKKKKKGTPGQMVRFSVGRKLRKPDHKHEAVRFLNGIVALKAPSSRDPTQMKELDGPL